MNACDYCSSHGRFWIFHPAATEAEPKKKACGEHLAMGVDEAMFEVGVVEVTVIVDEAS